MVEKCKRGNKKGIRLTTHPIPHATVCSLILTSQREPSYIKVRIKENIPDFLDPTNGNIIRRLYKGDLVALPEVVANILLKRNAAETVEGVEE